MFVSQASGDLPRDRAENRNLRLHLKKLAVTDIQLQKKLLDFAVFIFESEHDVSFFQHQIYFGM